jgi:hypothetical protein
MVAAIALKRILCGVEVDAYGQPLKAFSHPLDLSDDYQKGAYRAYTGVHRLTQKHSARYKAGRAAQCALLPKRQSSRSGKAIAWSRHMGGEIWNLGDNW